MNVMSSLVTARRDGVPSSDDGYNFSLDSGQLVVET